MTLCHFAFECGYVESSMLPLLFFSHDSGFATAYEALVHLVDRLEEYESRRFSSICPDHTRKSPDDVYCPRCGGKFVDSLAGQISVGLLFSRFFTEDLDSLSGVLEHLEEHGWCAETPTSKSVASTVFVGDSTRVMSTIHDDEDALPWLFLNDSVTGLDPQFEFDKGIPSERPE